MSTITSPRTLTTSRMTPWVEGCCGPMLMSISPSSRRVHLALALGLRRAVGDADLLEAGVLRRLAVKRLQAGDGAQAILLGAVEVDRVRDADLGVDLRHRGRLSSASVVRLAAVGGWLAGTATGRIAEAVQIPRLRALERVHAVRRRVGGVVGQDEVLALREGPIVGRHVDPPQVAVALEDDAHHVVHLALVEHRALPHVGDRPDPRVGAIDAGAHAQPRRMLPAEEVVDDLEVRVDAVVDRRLVGEHEEREVGIVAQRRQDLDVAGAVDAELDGVLVGPEVAQVGAEALVQRANERAGRGGSGQRTSPSQRIRCGPRSTYVGHWPRRSLTSSWSFIIP